MPPTDPWTFGLSHLLTVIGFIITAVIAFAGFRSFAKWKRERLEERKIEIALEALALAYEAPYIFDSIRSPISYDGEWSEMKGIDDPDKRSAAGPFFATLKRIERNKEYFERLWRMQPRFMAMFGKEASDVFMTLHQARQSIEVSASMLMRDAANNGRNSDPDFDRKLKADIWSWDSKNDQIRPLINEFVTGIEQHCLPVITPQRSEQLLPRLKTSR
jgi:hypothetical protein